MQLNVTPTCLPGYILKHGVLWILYFFFTYLHRCTCD